MGGKSFGNWNRVGMAYSVDGKIGWRAACPARKIISPLKELQGLMNLQRGNLLKYGFLERGLSTGLLG